MYASAVSVMHSRLEPSSWESFARFVLNAAYEATFRVVLAEGKTKIVLTAVGCGDFGNKYEWAADAISTALETFENSGLEVWFNEYSGNTTKILLAEKGHIFQETFEKK